MTIFISFITEKHLDLINKYCATRVYICARYNINQKVTHLKDINFFIKNIR